MPKVQIYHGVGKRKTAVARVWMRPGEGNIVVNKKLLDNYFPVERNRMTVLQPLMMTNMLDKFDVKINVRGGGITGQAEAIRHGISRALVEVNPELKETLKRAGLLTRDARVKERKKYGQRGARARFQYSKR